MIEKTSYAPGTFCWVELGTSHADSAKTFYSKLFGWDITDVPMGPDAFYTMFKIQGKDVAAAYEQGEQEKGIPPHWNSYISVDDVDAIAAKVPLLGGKVLAAPFDVMDRGRMAVLQDVEGAVIRIWQPRKHIGAQLTHQPGTLAWNELVVHDINKAREFYSKLFGWTYTIKEHKGYAYTTFMQGDVMVAGLMKMAPEWGTMPAQWGPYFAVSDCDKSVEQAKAMGGTILVEPKDIEGVGRFAVIQDPQGAFFSIITMKS